MFFPHESLEESSLLLVYDPTSPSASPSPLDKSKNLEDMANEVLKMAKEAGDVKSQLIEVEQKWHSAVVGKSGTTLNAIIGEDTTLSIKFGADSGETTEDVILVRGVASEVDRATKEIKAIVEKAKNYEIDNSFVRDVSPKGFGNLTDAHSLPSSPPSSRSIGNMSVALSALVVRKSTKSGTRSGFPSTSTKNLNGSRSLRRRKRRRLHKSPGSRFVLTF